MNETIAIDRAHADAAIGELDHGLSVVSTPNHTTRRRC